MPDYSTYEGLYVQAISDGFTFFMEVSFVFIAKLSNEIVKDNAIVLFIFYAILGVSLKFLLIKKLSTFWLYSVVIYISNYFILHEMIQIRAGVAAGFILLSIIPVFNRQLKYFIFLIFLATLFHYSSILFLSLWFLKSSNLNKPAYTIAIPLAYLVNFTGTDPLTLVLKFLSLTIYIPKISSYLIESEIGDLKIHIFGLFILSRMTILFYYFRYANIIFQYNKYIYILLKCYGIGIFSYIAFANYPVIAIRICYILLLVEIIIIPTLIYIIKERYVAGMVVICYALLAFAMNASHTTYFNWVPDF